ncbi:MAG TPA: hypothetical protein VN516_05245, partial [Candidatus Baltobacteraceae bacterium]|nr:hypothetical protein [Candidatus Baltobacteraceae bacterium]
MKSVLLLPLILWFARICCFGDSAIEDVWRLYDLTPVSTNNPVLATVKDSKIEIPLSEFRAFLRNSMHPGKEGKILTEADKRDELGKLLDDYFWVWDGYTSKADQTPEIAGMLAITRDEAMKALLIEQEADSKVTSLEEYEKLKQEIRQRIFNQAEIHVSTDAYKIIKAATAKTAGTNGVETMAANNLNPEQQATPLAICKAGTVSVGKFLQVYFQIPAESRPDLSTPDNIEKVLQEILADNLLLVEARERGLDKAEAVRTQVQADRTGLVRQWALDQITKKAAVAMNDAKFEDQLKKWYRAHLKSLYTVKEGDGGKRIVDFQKDHDLIQGDYFNNLQEQMRTAELQKLRKGKKIKINRKLLAQLVLTWPTLSRPAEMPSSLVAWNADTREFIAKAGDTNAVLSFTL